jgi:hypothetical protein
MRTSGRPQDPARILREFSSVVTDVVAAGGETARAEGLADWCRSLLDDPAALRLMSKLARFKADLERLLLVGLRFRTNRADYEGALARLSFGPAPVSEKITLPSHLLLRELVAGRIPEELSRDLPPVEILREIDRRLEDRNEQIRRSGGAPQEVWKPDDGGELRKVTYTPDEDGAFAWCFPLDSTPEHAPVPHERKGAGHPMDVAETVLAAMVAAHLKQVSGSPHLNLAGQYVVRVLQLFAPRGGDFSDNARAFENRARRHWRHDGVRARAKLLAEEFDIPIRFD